MAPKKKSKSRPKKSIKPKTKKSSKSKTRMSSKLKVKKSSKSKRGVMAKKGTTPKKNITAIPSQFHGTYTSTVVGVSTMNGTLVVPASNNSNNVAYTFDSDPSTSYSVTPTFNGNLISFSFAKGGVTYWFNATGWVAIAPSGGEWTGTAGNNAAPIEEQGSWKAQT